ncbi:MAG: glycosyltransferase family 39 protein [Chloroflexi bacterium]|nr:glycosyltransferase family 39 protein [Chloroflexota bacterium]
MNRKTFFVLAAITAGAALVRYWQIESLPPGQWNDQAHATYLALEILSGKRFPVYATDLQGYDVAFQWLLAAWMAVFGFNYHAARFLSALVGTLTVPITFFSLRKIYTAHPRRDLLAMCAALLLAFSVWHIVKSRIGLEVVMVSTASIALPALIVWAWQRNVWLPFALAGVALGASQYIYPAARILPLQALIVFLIFGYGQSFKRLLKFGFIFLVAALIVYAPLGWFFLNNPEWFLKRATTVSGTDGGLTLYATNLFNTLLSLNIVGDMNTRHNVPGRPVFDLVESAWMFVGVSVLLYQWRKHWRSHTLLIGGIIIGFLPAILSTDSPHFGRAIGAVPFLVIVPALGLTTTFDLWGRRRWVRWLIVISLAASPVITLYDYFVRYPREPRLFEEFETGLWLLNQNASRAAQNGIAYLILDDEGLSHYGTRLNRELTKGDLRLVNGAKCLAYPARTDAPLTFAAMRLWTPSVRAQSPQAATTNIVNESTGELYGVIFKVPAGQTSSAGASKALATFGDQFDLLDVATKDDYVSGQTALITLRWRTLRPSLTRYTTFVHLAAHDKPLVAGVDGEPCGASYPTDVWHKDEVVQYDLALQLPNDLPLGNYSVMIGMYNTATGERLAASQADQRESDRALARTITVK